MLRVCLLVFIAVTAQETCIPNPVGEIELLADKQLQWAPSQNCPNTSYRIRITTQNAREFQTTVPGLNFTVSFMMYCQSYTFRIAPIANNVLGEENYISADLPLPGSVDVAIQGLRGSLIADDVLIEWRIDSTYTNCVDYYHLFIYDDDREEVPEYLQVTRPGYLLQYVPSCANYRFEVASHYEQFNGTTEKTNYTVPAATNKPSLVYVSQSATTINTTWSLEKYDLNRCEIIALHIKGGTRFNVTYPIKDTEERQNVQVSVGGLRANSMYYFNVSVENSAGVSEAYQMAVQTLPVEPSPGVNTKIQ
ncbi:hypothetical protein NQ315_001391 [Exocentrus adspersus]|uniref:Fibronectin type-III domain-containing protein n=1 Tax=Exocentrus adspersus TaxID=1586481 RepID=A0AAV8WGK2_9CUCU|nr:hypothetical protein NQ315_001391 [Exocentrus adspersus]